MQKTPLEAKKTASIEAFFQHYAHTLKALAHPRRLEIVHLLRDQAMCVTDLAEMLGIPQANLSQHLLILKRVGIVRIDRNRKYVYYRLTDPNIIKACDLLRDMLIRDQSLKTDGQKILNDLPNGKLVTDPVCGMTISTSAALFSHAHDAKQYHFCASGCYELFLKNPKQYIQGSDVSVIHA